MPGLSPRERGNRCHVGVEEEHVGSIPARAGEPPSGRLGSRSGSVYPRASGGTLLLRKSHCSNHGLSPRERGNRDRARPGERLLGSIPARAGEPRARAGRGQRSWVYPRASGGTDTWSWAEALIEGLSPRERGNPDGQAGFHRVDGSIPRERGNLKEALDVAS